LLSPAGVHAAGEEIIDALMRSDFVFDLDVSNAPTPALASLVVTDYGESRFAGDCVPPSECEYTASQASFGGMLPIWVGRRDMFAAGASVTANRLEQDASGTTVYGAGFLAAWIRQATPRWQIGAFALPQWHSAVGDGGRDTGQFVGGAVARYRHTARFHTYYGLVWLSGDPDDLFLPYFGLDWYISRQWTLSLLAPWPAVIWAPSENGMVRIGAAPSGASWRFSELGRKRTADLSRWKFGVNFEGRVRGALWAGVGVGASGLGRLRISDGEGVDLDTEVEGEPYIELFLRFRPGS
jgi:hypothetical protein